MRLTQVGQANILRVGARVDADQAEGFDPVDLLEAEVHVPPGQNRLREQTVAGVGLHLGYPVVVGRRRRVAQLYVPGTTDLLATEATHVRVDNFGPRCPARPSN